MLVTLALLLWWERGRAVLLSRRVTGVRGVRDRAMEMRAALFIVVRCARGVRASLPLSSRHHSTITLAKHFFSPLGKNADGECEKATTACPLDTTHNATRSSKHGEPSDDHAAGVDVDERRRSAGKSDEEEELQQEASHRGVSLNGRR